MVRIQALCFAILCTGLHGLKVQPAPAATTQLRSSNQTVAEPPVPKVEVTPAPEPKIAFRTNAEGVTKPLGAGVGTLVKLSDDGFTLKVEKQGDDATFPKQGDTVTVHYVGMLKDGTVFDSSRARGEAFSFPIGRGKVIRGWDQGVITMSLGERATLHMPSYKAYGSSGAPPAIPPNAELDFDVELLAINGQESAARGASAEDSSRRRRRRKEKSSARGASAVGASVMAIAAAGMFA